MTERLALSCSPSSSVRPTFAPSVTAARRLRTSRASPIDVAVTPCSSSSCVNVLSGRTLASAMLSTLRVCFWNAASISVTEPSSAISTIVEFGTIVTGCSIALPLRPSPLPPAKRFIMTSLWHGSIQEANSGASVTMVTLRPCEASFSAASAAPKWSPQMSTESPHDVGVCLSSQWNSHFSIVHRSTSSKVITLEESMPGTSGRLTTPPVATITASYALRSSAFGLVCSRTSTPSLAT